MRTIKFRGQRIDNGEWVYGDLVINKPTMSYRIFKDFASVRHGDYSDSGLHECSGELYNVKPETVGQFIGIDTKGKEVYDGDYMRYKRRNGQWCKCTVVYENAGFSFENKTEQATYHAAIFMNKGKIYAEKIGNKFDSKPLTVNKFRHNEDF